MILVLIIQVDFLVNTTVASILTQGRDGVPNWVETYQVSYSNDSIDFRDYMESGTIKVLILIAIYNRNYVIYCITVAIITS